MSMDKAIIHGKEKRKPYWRIGKHDPTCRPHGSCPWCRGNRKHSEKKRELAANEMMKEEGCN
jgi:hypothetical protein